MKDFAVQTKETAALGGPRANEDLAEIYVDERRLETSSVLATRKLELSVRAPWLFALRFFSREFVF